jgi:hypothetical protein
LNRDQVRILKGEAENKAEIRNENQAIERLQVSQAELENEYKAAQAGHTMTVKELADMKKQIDAGKLALAQLKANVKSIERQQKTDIAKTSSDYNSD